MAVTLLVIGYFVVGGPAGAGPANGLDVRVMYDFWARRGWLPGGVLRLVPLLAIVSVGARTAVLWRRHDGSRSRKTLAVIVSFVGTYVLCALGQWVFARARPAWFVSAAPGPGFSFPAGTVALATAGVVASTAVVRIGARRWVDWAGSAVLCVGIGAVEVALRVYWLVDVAVGAFLGGACAAVSVVLVTRFDLRGALLAAERDRAARRHHRRVGAAAVAVVLVLAIPIESSYERALTFPGSASWQLRSVDWLRGNRGAGAVDWVEAFWYSRMPQADGGRTPTLRNPFGNSGETARPDPGVGPAAIATPVRPRLPHEGLWAPGPVRRHGRPALYTAQWRPDVARPSLAVAALWIDHSLTEPVLVAGTRDPTSTGWPWNAQIPAAMRDSVVAAFNGGFRLDDNVGGFWIRGRVGRPLVLGRASLIIRNDGQADVRPWTNALRVQRSIIAVRQNLDLIVDHGRIEPGIGLDKPGHRWSSHFIQAEQTWRSGVGIDRHGNLIYVAGPSLDMRRLAEAMTEVGIVRGMALDLHPAVVTCNLFVPDASQPDGLLARKLIAGMNRPATRYLQRDQRDFVAIALR